MLISGLGLVVLFLINASWITKTIWLIALVGSIFQWIVGLQQRDLATRINRLFSTDINFKQEDDQ